MKPVSKNELLVNLIRVAEVDAPVRTELCDILRHRPFHRSSILSYYIVQMKGAGGNTGSPDPVTRPAGI